MFDITEEYSQIRYNNNFQKNKKAMLFELHQRECCESLSEDEYKYMWFYWIIWKF